MNFANHFNKGGVLIIEPWFTKSTYLVGESGMTTYDGKDVKIALLNTTKIEGDLSIMDMHYLIVERNEDVTHYIDTHELGLFDIEKTLEIIAKTDIQAEI